MFPRLTTALGTGAVMLYHVDARRRTSRSSPPARRSSCSARALLAEATPPPPDEIRALLARAVELTRPEHLAFAGLPARDATRLLDLGRPPVRPRPRCARPSRRCSPTRTSSARTTSIVKAALPVKLRTRLEQLLADDARRPRSTTRSTSPSAQRNADRAALLARRRPAAIAALAKARGETAPST